MLLVRIIVNALTLLIIVILPDIYFVEPTVLRVLFLAVMLGILNAFVKPIIQFLTLRFIFITYGFAIVIINTIILLLLNILFRDRIVVDSLIWALVGGALMGLAGAFLENLFGMQVPIFPEDADPLPELSSDPSKAFERKLARGVVGPDEELVAELPLATSPLDLDEPPTADAVDPVVSDVDEQPVSGATIPDAGALPEEQTTGDIATETMTPIEDEVAEAAADTDVPQQGEER